MLTALILTTFISTAEAHQPHHHQRHRSHHVHNNHQHNRHCAHAPRGHVWVTARGWTPRHMVRWIPGHYTGRGHNRHWVPGKFVVKIRI